MPRERTHEDYYFIARTQKNRFVYFKLLLSFGGGTREYFMYICVWLLCALRASVTLSCG